MWILHEPQALWLVCQKPSLRSKNLRGIAFPHMREGINKDGPSKGTIFMKSGCKKSWCLFGAITANASSYRTITIWLKQVQITTLLIYSPLNSRQHIVWDPLMIFSTAVCLKLYHSLSINDTIFAVANNTNQMVSQELRFSLTWRHVLTLQHDSIWIPFCERLLSFPT